MKILQLHLRGLETLMSHGMENKISVLVSDCLVDSLMERFGSYCSEVACSDSCQANYASYAETLTTINFSINFKIINILNKLVVLTILSHKNTIIFLKRKAKTLIKDEVTTVIMFISTNISPPIRMCF